MEPALPGGNCTQLAAGQPQTAPQIYLGLSVALKSGHACQHAQHPNIQSCRSFCWALDPPSLSALGAMLLVLVS